MITPALCRLILSTRAPTQALCSRMVTIFVTMAQRDLDLLRMGAAVIVRVVGGGGGGEDGYEIESGLGAGGRTILLTVCFPFS